MTLTESQRRAIEHNGRPPAVNDGGLKTTVFLVTNAGRAFRFMTFIGKFHRLMMPATPQRSVGVEVCSWDSKRTFRSANCQCLYLRSKIGYSVTADGKAFLANLAAGPNISRPINVVLNWQSALQN
jgi:hypothetical protein